ncbi:CrcB family protein [Ornithinimicrobium sp. INDO-MA30-4]|uniref:fluoride efflux transporter FluC n=1 Tax=Ornithinimicrobium sp. INDO-MA30-4 TaxID=2908651 RepID=UPI001F41F54B|nr:CrcB family protein [Ornithinimicrobium sp. INDO-MA30-4]UJH70537.1 CrcB family protein [Ornithinimicrobium sp. INDO-MA30-4]
MHVDRAQLTLVAAGGAIGAVLRWSVELLYPSGAGTFPLATLLTNVVGCFVLGIVAELATRDKVTANGKLFVGTGLLGGFTTFSTYAVQVAVLGGAGVAGTSDLAIGLSYLLVTPVLCVLVAGSGMSIARRLTPRMA